MLWIFLKKDTLHLPLDSFVVRTEKSLWVSPEYNYPIVLISFRLSIMSALIIVVSLQHCIRKFSTYIILDFIAEVMPLAEL